MFRPFKYIPLSRLPFKYLPPNFATAANMIVGFLAIVFSVKGEFETAAWLIVLSVFIDGIDGMLARILKAQSHFGIEFDSFSDFVSFGIAPAAMVLCYLVSGDFVVGQIGSLMWISVIGAIFYALMAAIRLARFNVQTIALGDKLFQGIPTTACAGIIAASYLTLHKYGNPVKDPADLVYLSIVTFVGFGSLMVSRIPLLKLRRRSHLSVNILERGTTVLCLLLAIARRLPDVLLAVGIVHIVLGIRYGIKMERDVKKEKDLPGVVLEK
jgi:CDP-diacylglycerol--serine O-phosphatidyltransferase